jgi:hypothetical protein
MRLKNASFLLTKERPGSQQRTGPFFRAFFVNHSHHEPKTWLNFCYGTSDRTGRVHMKNQNKITVTAPKPRNPFIAFMMRRKAGEHRPERRAVTREEKDLVQRLREAGL